MFELICVECGAQSLEDMNRDSRHFLSVDFDDETTFISSTFTLKCLICGTRINTRLMTRRYYPPFDDVENIRMDYHYYGSIAAIQADLKDIDSPLPKMRKKQRQFCADYERAVREGRINDALQLLTQAENILPRKIEAWLKVAHHFGYSELVYALEKFRADYLPPYFELLHQAVEEARYFLKDKHRTKKVLKVYYALVKNDAALMPYPHSEVLSEFLRRLYSA